jgi:hypothetical protein
MGAEMRKRNLRLWYQGAGWLAYPDVQVQKKLKREVKRVLGNRTTITEAVSTMSFRGSVIHFISSGLAYLHRGNIISFIPEKGSSDLRMCSDLGPACLAGHEKPRLRDELLPRDSAPFLRRAPCHPPLRQ